MFTVNLHEVFVVMLSAILPYCRIKEPWRRERDEILLVLISINLTVQEDKNV